MFLVNLLLTTSHLVQYIGHLLYIRESYRQNKYVCIV